MKITQAYRYELQPNNVQKTLLAKHAGAARFAWNWGLAQRVARFETREGKERFTNAIEQHREWNRWKQEHTPWVYEEIHAPKPLQRNLRMLRRRSRQHARKQNGSQNRKKSARHLAQLHRRIRNQRTDFLHQVTTRLVKTKSVLVVEDLHVRGMVRNRHLARHIVDAGWSTFRRMLEYKTR